jgi:hypothetical protein
MVFFISVLRSVRKAIPVILLVSTDENTRTSPHKNEISQDYIDSHHLTYLPFTMGDGFCDAYGTVRRQ